MHIWVRDIMLGAALAALVYFIFARRQRLELRGWGLFAAALLGASMAAVFSVTGVSPISGFHTDLRLSGVNLIPFAGIKAVVHGGFDSYAAKNVLGNILLFLPLGFFAPLLFSDCGGFWRSAALGLFVSLLIECTQLFLSRGTDVDDLLLNTVGAALGYGLYRLTVLRGPGHAKILRLTGAAAPLLSVLLPYLLVVILGIFDRAAYLAM